LLLPRYFAHKNKDKTLARKELPTIGVTASGVLLVWLKILIAPKLFLLEYISDLIK